jgi:hypothetical protein
MRRECYPAHRRLGIGVILLLTQLLGACGGDGGGSTGPDDPPAPQVPCLIGLPQCSERVPVGSALFQPVFRTHPIQTGDTSVVRAVIVVHGADRNPDAYFDRMVKAVSLAGLLQTTLVVSPHFQTVDDGPGVGEPAWTPGGWKRGHLSVSGVGNGERISSYESIDDVLAYLGNRSLFPKLESVVVTGHSAGGQYAHRFAATSPAAEGLNHLRFRYVVVNPSTYLYLGPERAVPGGGFDLPDREACPDYNEWHYGMEDRNSYALRLTEEGIRDRLVSRDVVYMVGSADTGEAALDMTCGAMLQGMHRYARGLTLHQYIKGFYPESDHGLVEVEGVGHSSTRMYQSTKGRQVLFEW